MIVIVEVNRKADYPGFVLSSLPHRSEVCSGRTLRASWFAESGAARLRFIPRSSASCKIPLEAFVLQDKQPAES